MKERDFQRHLETRIRGMFPRALVLRPNPQDIQGFPDILILAEKQWAALEVKRSKDAPTRPNQAYYVDILDDLSFARFIHPDNEEEVIDALSRAFRV